MNTRKFLSAALVLLVSGVLRAGSEDLNLPYSPTRAEWLETILSVKFKDFPHVNIDVKDGKVWVSRLIGLKESIKPEDRPFLRVTAAMLKTGLRAEKNNEFPKWARNLPVEACLNKGLDMAPKIEVVESCELVPENPYDSWVEHGGEK